MTDLDIRKAVALIFLHQDIFIYSVLRNTHVYISSTDCS